MFQVSIQLFQVCEINCVVDAFPSQGRALLSLQPVSHSSWVGGVLQSTTDYSKRICEGCSKSNASYFVMLIHDNRGRWRWYSSKRWTFLPIFPYILLPCNGWQQRSSLTECLAWKCGWSRGEELNSPMWEKKNGTCWPSLMVAEYLWRSDSGCEHSEVVGDVFQQWQQQYER